MQTRIRALVLSGVFLVLLLSIQMINAVPTHADRGTWAVGVVYNLDDTVAYNGSIYRCIEAHVSQPLWTPDDLPNMWQLVRDNPITSPYTDVNTTSIQTAYQATGQKYYALAFILAYQGTCEASWDGMHPMSENFYAGEIGTLRSEGGNVNGVFGGAYSSDLASACTTVDNLEAAYQAVVDQYQFKWLDWNIGSIILSDRLSVDRRNKAIAALEHNNPTLRVSFTLPVTRTGLAQAALDLLENARASGVQIDYVNILAMDYGVPDADMGQAAIAAALRTHDQLRSLGISAKIGITPMIGQNDTAGEIFSLANAQALVTFAKANAYVGWLSFWSLGRDTGSCPGAAGDSAGCSGVAQDNYAFTTIFKNFP